MLNREIEKIIRNILIVDGPDGHYDGADVITDFVEALIQGNGQKWKDEYYIKHKINEKT